MLGNSTIDLKIREFYYKYKSGNTGINDTSNFSLLKKPTYLPSHENSEEIAEEEENCESVSSSKESFSENRKI